MDNIRGVYYETITTSKPHFINTLFMVVHGGLAAYAVVTTLAVHSFLAGLALGAEAELSGVLVIFLAILAHKSTAGFALGVSLVRNQIPSRLAWPFSSKARSRRSTSIWNSRKFRQQRSITTSPSASSR